MACGPRHRTFAVEFVHLDAGNFDFCKTVRSQVIDEAGCPPVQIAQRMNGCRL